MVKSVESWKADVRRWSFYHPFNAAEVYPGVMYLLPLKGQRGYEWDFIADPILDRLNAELEHAQG